MKSRTIEIIDNHIKALEEELEWYQQKNIELQDKYDIEKEQLEQERDYLDGRCAALENDLVLDDVVSKLDKVKTRLAELEAQQRWIPVSEREPEENRYVLVTDGKQVFEAKCYKKYDELKWVWQGYDIDENITHWMLKPQPPKDGE